MFDYFLDEADFDLSTKVVENFETSTMVPLPQCAPLTHQLPSTCKQVAPGLQPHAYPLLTPRRRPRLARSLG